MFSPEMPRQVGEARAEWRILRELAAAVDPRARRPARLRERPGHPRRDRARRAVLRRHPAPAPTPATPSSTAARTCAPGGRFPTADGKARSRSPCRCRRDDAPAGHVRGQHAARQAVQHAHLRRGRSAHRRRPRRGPDAPRRRRRAAPRRAATASRCVSEHGRFDGRVHLAPIARGNLQVHWPEGNALLAAASSTPSAACPTTRRTCTSNGPEAAKNAKVTPRVSWRDLGVLGGFRGATRAAPRTTRGSGPTRAGRAPP